MPGLVPAAAVNPLPIAYCRSHSWISRMTHICRIYKIILVQSLILQTKEREQLHWIIECIRAQSTSGYEAIEIVKISHNDILKLYQNQD